MQPKFDFSYYYGEILLDYDSASTEEILSHNFEELLKKRESSMEEEHETYEDSLAAILSARLGRTMKMKDSLAATYTDGKDVYYWNHFWGDMVKVPEGFEVCEHINGTWQIPHGTNFHGVVDGKDTVDVFVYAAYQVVYDDDESFREKYLPNEIEERNLVDVSSQFKYGTATLGDGSQKKYLYCAYEGRNCKNGRGEYHKDIRSLFGTYYSLTVVYPLPKSRKVASIIKELSSYPNIADYSHLGSYNKD